MVNCGSMTNRMKTTLETIAAIILCMGLATLFVAWFAAVFAVIHAYVFCSVVKEVLLE